MHGDILAGAAVEGQFARALELRIDGLAGILVLLAMVEMAPDGATLGGAGLHGQLKAAAPVPAIGLPGIARSFDLQAAIALQECIADLGLTAANTRAFE